MSKIENANVQPGALFMTGWALLLLSAGLMALNHVFLMFYLDQPVLFAGWSAFNLYALLVIAIPFRRLEKWAWYATWVLPIGLAGAGFGDPDIAILYYAVAAVCAVGLLLTMRAFFATERPVVEHAP